jgi:uncharacterized protein YbjT (DUF2867 family)
MSTVWLAGGSGLVGGVLLRRLLEDASVARVVSVGRRRLSLEHPKLTQVVVDLAAPGAFAGLDPPQVAFCWAAKEKGARAFLHVTALGADPRSRVFYCAVKGEVERAVAELGFESVYALRPSILDGERDESRPGERVGLFVARALAPLLGKYRPTPVEAVARAMVRLARAPEPGSHAVDAGAIPGLGA